MADREDICVTGGDLAEHLEQVVLPVADGAEAQQEAPTGCAYAAHDLDHRLQAGLVVGQVHHDRDVAAG